MFWVVKDQEFDAETRILQSFQYWVFFSNDIKIIDWTTVQDNKKDSEERTAEVLERESKRVTPMKHLW